LKVGRGTTNPRGADGYPAATVVSRPARAAQTNGVVLIDTVLPYENARAAGTGMVLTASGQVLTSYHVVEGASKIKVTVAESGKTYQATVVGSDQTADVALLQLQSASGLDTIKIDNDRTSLGDKVIAVGNAGGTGTLTAAKGKVVSLKASITTAAEGPVASETLRAMIETTADVVSGDSGGPLFDTDGEVIGIDTAASSGREINGYAVPIQRALGIVHQIRSGKESSTVRVGPAPFLGVELSDAPSSEFGYPGAALKIPRAQQSMASSVAPPPHKRVSKPGIRSLHWAATPSRLPRTSHPSLLITSRVTASRSSGLTRQAISTPPQSP
jgi:S1-C subfamily serine protease